MKNFRFLLSLVAFVVAIGASFAINAKNESLTQFYGKDPSDNVCKLADLSPNQTGCGSGSSVICTVRFGISSDVSAYPTSGDCSAATNVIKRPS